MICKSAGCFTCHFQNMWTTLKLKKSFIAAAVNHKRHWGQFREVITQHIYWERFLLGTDDLMAILNGSFWLTPWEVRCKLKKSSGEKEIILYQVGEIGRHKSAGNQLYTSSELARTLVSNRPSNTIKFFCPVYFFGEQCRGNSRIQSFMGIPESYFENRGDRGMTE